MSNNYANPRTNAKIMMMLENLVKTWEERQTSFKRTPKYLQTPRLKTKKSETVAK
jgi:hypothetical protein